MKRDTRAWWTVPILLALVTGVGLASALLGDGGWDVLSWVLLGVPVAVCVWFGFPRPSDRSPRVRSSIRTAPSGSPDPN